ncbi:MAG: CHAD domain-containing protein, partial [Actinomycetota bacterium]|nr:CHAD domain-containing protein [Actinomycetota bacterium]
MAQPDMPKAAYRRENRFLRDTARLISDARDADVMLQTLDGLSERFVGRLPERSFRELRDRLAEEADRSQGQSRASTADDVVDALEAATARVRDWPVDRCGKNALNAGAMRAYDRGRVAYATVVRGNSSVEG